MLCTFKATDQPGVHICEHCGQIISSTSSPERTYRECGQVADRSGPCVHIGKQLGLEDCTSCRGRVRKRTFECAVWGKCTVSQCRTCVDYFPGNVDTANPLVIIDE